MIKRGKTRQVCSASGLRVISLCLPSDQVSIRKCPPEQCNIQSDWTYQDLGMRRNIESILGPNPLLWCCPSRTPGSGLTYELSNNDGEGIELSSLQSKDGSHDLA